MQRTHIFLLFYVLALDEQTSHPLIGPWAKLVTRPTLNNTVFLGAQEEENEKILWMQNMVSGTGGNGNLGCMQIY